MMITSSIPLLCVAVFVAGYGAYQCWGELEIAYPGLENAPGQYLRELDLDTATCRVSYAAKDKNQNLCHDLRQYFVSHADGVAVLHTKRQEGDLCCTIRLKPSHFGHSRKFPRHSFNPNLISL